MAKSKSDCSELESSVQAAPDRRELDRRKKLEEERRRKKLQVRLYESTKMERQLKEDAKLLDRLGSYIQQKEDTELGLAGKFPSIKPSGLSGQTTPDTDPGQSLDYDEEENTHIQLDRRMKMEEMVCRLSSSLSLSSSIKILHLKVPVTQLSQTECNLPLKQPTSMIRSIPKDKLKPSRDSLQDKVKQYEMDLAKHYKMLWWCFYNEEVKKHMVLKTDRTGFLTGKETAGRVDKTTVQKILELLCDQMGFLLKSETLALLATLEKDQQTLQKSYLILSAIGVQSEDGLYELVDFILNYRKHGREQENECMEVSGEQGETEEDLTDVISPNDIQLAIKEFIAQYSKPTANH